MSTIKTWVERLPDGVRFCPSTTEMIPAMREEIAELRAALAASGGNAAPELPEPLEINWPTLNPHALGCGVEDRGLHDRYECAEYGWEDGVDRAIGCVPDVYDADQMRAYGKACSQSGPNAALVAALEALIEVAEQCDSWESFPGNALAQARMALSAAGQEVGHG